MSGTNFVQAVAMWLIMLMLGVTLVAAAVASGAVWALVLMLALVWVPLTLRWAWLTHQGGAR